MFSKFKRSSGGEQPGGAQADAGLAAFASEDQPSGPSAAEGETVTHDGRRGGRVLLAAAVLVCVAAVGAATWQYRRLAPRPALLTVETTVPGADVSVAGASVGRTPLQLSLKPGSYDLQVSQGAVRRHATLDLVAGGSVVRHFDLGGSVPAGGGATPAALPGGGQSLRIETEPAALPVLVDAIERGPSPVSVKDLTPGLHEVTIRTAGGPLRHTVALRAGESTVVVFSSPAKVEPAGSAAAGAAGGWLAVASAVPVQIREAGKVVGSSDMDRLMLPAGNHALEFVNEPLGYQSRRTVRIEPGKTASIQLERVNGVLSVNALPWAEVWIGGERVGQTPIGNLSRPIGTYDVLLRHPELGERRERVTITAKQPARLGVDLRRK